MNLRDFKTWGEFHDCLSNLWRTTEDCPDNPENPDFFCWDTQYVLMYDGKIQSESKVNFRLRRIDDRIPFVIRFNLYFSKTDPNLCAWSIVDQWMSPHYYPYNAFGLLAKYVQDEGNRLITASQYGNVPRHFMELQELLSEVDVLLTKMILMPRWESFFGRWREYFHPTHSASRQDMRNRSNTTTNHRQHPDIYDQELAEFFKA